jgi:Methyltransferase domain
MKSLGFYLGIPPHGGAAKTAVRTFVDLAWFTLVARRFRALSVSSRAKALPHLRTAWGNLGFTADVSYLLATLDYAAGERGQVLECGSGLTTLLLALVAPNAVWALEHMEEWQSRVQTRLRLAGTEAHVLLAPLTSYGRFQWYEVPATLPREFRLVVCDGPPGTTSGGRYGLLPLLGDRLPKGTVILLDDAQRLDEQGVLQRWEKEAGWRHTIKDSDAGAYAVVTV